MDGRTGSTETITTETWFDRARRNNSALDALRTRPIAYFCAEYGLDDRLPIYSGGLGILAGDVLKEASDLGLPMVGIGLFYRRGFFTQYLDDTGYQRELYPTVEPGSLGLSRAPDATGRWLTVEVPIGDHIVYACVWRLRIGVIDLYLLDTETDENRLAADRAITGNLYGGDQETRIQQELVLGVGGVRALRALGIVPSVYSMNEGHAAFLAIELLLEVMQGQPLDDALAVTRSRVVYTNHTVVPAGNDVFPRELVSRYVAPYASSHGLTNAELLELGGESDFSMAVLALNLSAKANAVSRIHAEAMANEPDWSRFAIVPITNGVHVPTWLGPDIRALLDQHLPDWRAGDPDWDQIDAIPPASLWSARCNQRRRLIRMVETHAPGIHLGDGGLVMVWARRFAPYKRADLLIADMERLAALMSGTPGPLTLIIAGKAHPKDEDGKRVLQSLLLRLRSHPVAGARFIFIPDYSITVAKMLVQGADVWLNTPRKPLEASGTSGMKSSDNGGLQLTVEDGWAAEVNWDGLGWGIEGRDDTTDAEQLYHHLETSILPLFYRRNSDGIPEAWVTMMERSMKLTLSRYSARRMLLEYLDQLYLPPVSWLV